MEVEVHRGRLPILVSLLSVSTWGSARAAEPSALKVAVEAGDTHRMEATARWKPATKVLELGGELQVEGRIQKLRASVPVGRIVRRVGEDLRSLSQSSQSLLVEVGASLAKLPAPKFELPELPSFAPHPSLRDGLFATPASSGQIESWAGPPLTYRLAYEEPRAQRGRAWGRLGDPLQFERAMGSQWRRMGRFLQSRGLRCRETRLLRGELVVWAVSWTRMNTPWRVAEAKRRFGREYTRRGGFYLPDEPSRGASFISVSGVGEARTRALLGHELAHFAYSACGLRRAWGGDTESFARAFEAWAHGG